MNLRSIVAVSAVALAAIACGPQKSAPTSDGTWFGTITTEGNVTTVVNESGSVWGGTARLVEEVSIGVEAGSDEYMLGQVTGVAGSSERIYVIDRSVPAVRSYTWDGEYIGDLGREGRGPGEYVWPAAIDVSDDGRVFVHARTLQRVNAYSEAGEFLTSHALPFTMSVPMVLGKDGTTFGAVLAGADGAYSRPAYGFQAHGPEGPFGEVLVPPRFEFEIPHLGGPRGLAVPHAPDYAWAMDRERTLIAGVSDDYRFRIVRADGAELIVHREYDPIPIDEEERQDAIRGSTEFIRKYQDTGTWDGPPVPHFKPAFLSFMPSRSGDLWVIRPGTSKILGRVASTGETVWQDIYIVDAFDRDGRFLGEVEMPAGVRGAISAYVTNHGGPFAFVLDDVVIMPVEDEAGTIMVKRYRLVLPGEEQ